MCVFYKRYFMMLKALYLVVSLSDLWPFIVGLLVVSMGILVYVYLKRYREYRAVLEEEVRVRTQVMERDRNRLNAILQNMADAILVTSPYGRILLVNAAFEHLVHRSSRVILAGMLSDVLDLPLLSQTIERAFDRPNIVYTVTVKMPVLEVKTASQDFTAAHRILKASVTGLGDRSAVITILRDVTYEVEIDRMKSEFISAVSHEFRTPLTSILGFAKVNRRILERVVLPNIESDGRIAQSLHKVDNNLEIMLAEGQHLTKLVDDVLDFAALDTGKIQWSDRAFDVLPLIQRVVTQYKQAFEEKGLNLQVDVNDSFPIMYADPDRIFQVLDNFLSNALKFTESGRVVVSARWLAAGEVVDMWAVPELGGVLISVQDTGCGIAPEIMPGLFQYFRQLTANALTAKPQGIGLGLAICWEIINHYAGRIWAESVPGSGSTFSFVLPRSREMDNP